MIKGKVLKELFLRKFPHNTFALPSIVFGIKLANSDVGVEMRQYFASGIKPVIAICFAIGAIVVRILVLW